MNSIQIKQLVFTSLFISLSAILAILQIPIGDALKLDFSFVALLLSVKYVGNKAYIIAFVYPWFYLLNGGNVVGVAFIIMQALFLLAIDGWLNKDKYKISNIAITIALVTIFSLIINILLIAPLYYGVKSYWTEELIKNIVVWSIISLVFNPIKLIIIYIILVPTWRLIQNISENNENSTDEVDDIEDEDIVTAEAVSIEIEELENENKNSRLYKNKIIISLYESIDCLRYS